jgi:hypothetical protein
MRPHAHPLLGIMIVQTDKTGYRKYVMQIHHGTLEKEPQVHMGLIVLQE